MLGFAGQLAWAVENQFFNTFMYDKITPDPRPISWMVAASAVTATVTSILMGALSDRTRSRWGRRPYLLFGYLAWGIFTAAYPLASFLHPIALAVGLAILFDCVMTFFGSTANDSNLNAYVADVTTVENRGRVTGVLEIMTWVALLIVYGGAGLIIQAWGYYAFFYLIGGLVFVLGLVGGWLIREPTAQAESPRGSFWSQIAGTLRWQSLREQRALFLILLAMGLWGVAQQIFFPYLIIYLNHFLRLPTAQASLLIFIAILVGGILMAYPFGLLTDRWGRQRMALLSVGAEVVGLFLFSLARSMPALVITGILWLAPISAWTIATAAWSKDLFPEEKRGQFAGYVILFTEAFTMVPGPLIGSWLATQYGLPTVLEGRPGFIPTSIIFQAAAIATILAAVPLFWVNQVVAKAATGRPPNIGHTAPEH